MDPTLRREILDILSQASDLTIATLREDGYPQATTVSYANDDLEIYFGTSAGSQKAKNLGGTQRSPPPSALPYRDWGDIRGLSMSGKAERLTDPPHIAHAEELLQRRFSQSIAQYASAPSGRHRLLPGQAGADFGAGLPQGVRTTPTGRVLVARRAVEALIRARWPRSHGAVD